MLAEMEEVWGQTLGWQPTPEQQALFQQFYELVLQGNRQFNLTRITEPQEFLEKHLWDSLSGIKPWIDRRQRVVDGEPQGETDGQRLEATLPWLAHLSIDPSAHHAVIDIGTGAGFPGIPVAIVCPDWNVTLLDSTRKKLAFVEQVLSELKIRNASTVVDRAEQAGHNVKHRSTYDLALVRAVAAASVCAEYALPMLKVGGVAVLYRGHWADEEAIGLQLALEKLGGALEQVESFLTPLTQGVRHCLYLRKLSPTPIEFPRSIGIPSQKPLYS